MTAVLTLNDYNKNIMDNRIYITETYENGAAGYRVWSDGYCEQWGIADYGSYVTSCDMSVTLLKPYKDTNYKAFACKNDTSSQTNSRGVYTSVYSQTTTNMQVCCLGTNSTTTTRYVAWETKGYIEI